MLSDVSTKVRPAGPPTVLAFLRSGFSEEVAYRYLVAFAASLARSGFGPGATVLTGESERLSAVARLPDLRFALGTFVLHQACENQAAAATMGW